jgi:hypothetical protein
VNEEGQPDETAVNLEVDAVLSFLEQEAVKSFADSDDFLRK